MKLWPIFAVFLCVVVSPINSSAQQFGTLYLPGGTIRGDPVPQHPVDPDMEQEEIVYLAQREITGRQYFNRPGATMDDYYDDWLTCHLISKGSSVSFAPTAYVYNPANVSPMAAGIGGAIGAGIGSAFAEQAVIDSNRRNCLYIKGWRRIRPRVNVGAGISQREGEALTAYLERYIGEDEPAGKILEEWEDNVMPNDPLLKLDTPMPLPAALWLGEGVSADTPLVWEEDEALAVLAFRRPDERSEGERAFLRLLRYDPEAGDLEIVARMDAEKGQSDDKDQDRMPPEVTQVLTFASVDRKAPYEIHVARLTPGYYVIDSVAAGSKGSTATFCFGAPLMSIEAGKASYIGDWVPFRNARLSDGRKITRALALAPRIDETRHALADLQPTVAEALVPMKLANNATYSCAGGIMSKWGLAGVDDLSIRPPVRQTTQGEATAPSVSPAAASSAGAGALP